MSVLLITTTHGRPKAFAALQKWVELQSAEEFHWLIVCDDWDGYKFPPKSSRVTVIKRDASEDDDSLPSLNRNWLAALDWIDQHEDYDKMIVLEDDDFYHRDYVRETRKHLDAADLVGWNEDAYYYVLSRRARRVHNQEHASLAATGFKRSVLPYLRECVQKGDIFIDCFLWLDKAPRNIKKRLVDNFTGIVYGSREQPKMDNKGNIANEYPRHVGMKTPWHGGAEGLSTKGHDPAQGGGSDILGVTLRKWIGEEAAEFYLKFTVTPDGPWNRRACPPNMMLPLPMDSDEMLARM